MPRAVLDDSVLVVVDIQPTFLKPILEADRVLKRSRFLVEAARTLGVPIFVTEQYPERMGHTDESILQALPESATIAPKMSFSCVGCASFAEQIGKGARRQAVLCGIETHICVSQTAHELAGMGLTVFVAADAVSSRTQDRHEIGLDRMVAAGITSAHSESIVYEWMRSAEHPLFREVLSIVKRYD